MEKERAREMGKILEAADMYVVIAGENGTSVVPLMNKWLQYFLYSNAFLNSHHTFLQKVLFVTLRIL